jgi:outer membrane protein assembly factor BamB
MVLPCGAGSADLADHSQQGNERNAGYLPGSEYGSGDLQPIGFQPDTFYRIHAINSYATPTPALEEGFVYMHFGRYGTACLNSRTGEKVWERTDLKCEHIQGPGSSLLIYKDKLIVHLEGTDVQWILALDKRTGKTLWKTERPGEVWDRMPEIGKKAYITPIIIQSEGRDLMISNGSAACIAYDPKTGKEVWRIVQGDDSTISMPVEGDGRIFFYTSFVTGEDGRKYAELFAVDPDGQGDIGNTHILWRMKAASITTFHPGGGPWLSLHHRFQRGLLPHPCPGRTDQLVGETQRQVPLFTPVCRWTYICKLHPRRNPGI